MIIQRVALESCWTGRGRGRGCPDAVVEDVVLLGATGVRRPRDERGLPGVGGGIAGPGRISTGSR